MHEDFGTIISRGVNSWVRNLNICIPFILSFFVNLILYFLFFGLMGILLFTSNTGSIIDPASIPTEELYSMMWEGFTENILSSALLVLMFLLFGMFVQSFFTAGAIGMAKKASETGDTVLSDMLVSGSKNIFRLFLTTLLMALLLLGGMVFLVPGALSVGNLSGLIENPEASVHGMTALAIGTLIWGVYMMIINIVLSLAPYALVIDELNPLDSLRMSFNFFMGNKLDVLFIWILYVGLSSINTLVGEFIGSESTLLAGFTYLAPVVILQPLAAVLWTRLYVSRKGKKLYNPSDLLSNPEGF